MKREAQKKWREKCNGCGLLSKRKPCLSKAKEPPLEAGEACVDSSKINLIN